jgi:Domain of unknown function (DUF1905)
MDSPRHVMEFSAACWLYSGKAAWHFVTLPPEAGLEIKYFSQAASGGKRSGWGSVRIMAQIGNSTWGTSVFPDSQTGSYLLPIKAAVRKAECITAGQSLRVKLSMAMP